MAPTSSEDSTEPLIRVMALHALAYGERLFYLEEVEEIRIADPAVYAGRRLHEELAASDEGDSEACLAAAPPTSHGHASEPG
jgi:CRISPR-associated protein Cas1